MTPARDRNGYRRFGADDVGRVRQIHALIGLGMSVADIRQVRECLDATSPVPTCAATVGALRARLAEVDAQIARLVEHRGRLSQILRAAHRALPVDGDGPRRTGGG